MSRSTRNLALGLGGVAVMLLLYDHFRHPAEEPDQLSPDGTYALRAWVNKQHSGGDAMFNCVVFEIRNRSGALVHRENTRAPGSARWRIGWDGQNRVWLNSVETGLEYWAPGLDARWHRFAYKPDSAPTPPASVRW
jgi:hypothetical protein